MAAQSVGEHWDDARQFLFTPTASADFPSYCSRFMKGHTEAEFANLSDEPGRLLSWVSPPDQIHTVARACATPFEAMVAVGFDPAFLAARVADGTKFRLILIPTDRGLPFLPTWDNFFDRLEGLFGEELAARVAPHQEALKTMSYEEIDPEETIDKIALLPKEAKRSHPNYMTTTRFLAIATREAVTLHDARAFFYHSLGCNRRFLGNGSAPNGGVEWVVPNCPVDQIEGRRLYDVELVIPADHAICTPK